MVFCTGCDGCGCVELGCELCAVHTARISAPHNHSHHNQCRTPYAAVHTLFLPMMGIMMPETCWDESLIINIGLVASCWFLSLQTTQISNSMKIRPVGAELFHANRQTDRHDDDNSRFCNFANAPPSWVSDTLSTVPELQAGQTANRGKIPDEAKIFFFTFASRRVLDPSEYPIQWARGLPSAGGGRIVTTDFRLMLKIKQKIETVHKLLHTSFHTGCLQ